MSSFCCMLASTTILSLHFKTEAIKWYLFRRVFKANHFGFLLLFVYKYRDFLKKLMNLDHYSISILSHHACKTLLPTARRH